MTNIALVVLDTLRKDAFDRHFEWLPGRRFECAYTTANWTVPAHASLFTGRYASEVGIHAKNMYCNCSEPTLAEQLREADYTTRAFSANTNITGHFGFDRGFTDFRTPEQFEHMTDDDLFDWREFSRMTDSTGARKYFEAVRHGKGFRWDQILSRNRRNNRTYEQNTEKGEEFSRKILQRVHCVNLKTDDRLAGLVLPY